MRRRDLLAAGFGAGITAALPARAQGAAPIVRKGRIKQGLWRTTFGVSFNRDEPPRFTTEDMCREAARLGAAGFDLMPFDAKPTLDQYGLKNLLTGPGEMDFLTGVIHPEVHDVVERSLKDQADQCAAYGVPSIAVNAGQLRGLSFAEAADNAVEVLNRVKDHLEERGVAVAIENVNDHRPDEPALGREDMAFGHWDWGMEVVERVDSPSVKLLCDIYHLQIMDGDVSRRIRDSIHRIAHFHVAGVPTRGEIDEPQELNYRYIAEVIASLDYQGYVSHEWRPAPGQDPLESIARAMDVLDV